jgi:hypothetical protein
MNEIADAIQKLTNTYNKEVVSIIKCTVISIDSENIICLPINSHISSEIYCPLQNEGNNISYTPSVDSVIYIGITNFGLILLLHSEDNDIINISANDSIEFNGGEFGGLVKVEELTTKLNNLENLVNSLVAKYNTHVHASNGVPTVTLETTVLTPTIQSTIENETVKHGN